jgi:hypothetical protein
MIVEILYNQLTFEYPFVFILFVPLGRRLLTDVVIVEICFGS